MKSLKSQLVLGGCVLSLLAGTMSFAQPTMDQMWGNEQRAKIRKGERGALFEWGNYAMFVHWGVYSHLANRWNGKTYYGIGEWLINPGMANADKKEYKSKVKEFNPVNFDAKAIVQLAKDAGMKYIVITSKHHDGFAMFHSKCDPFNIVDATPFKRDPMKELSEACKEAGLGFGFYYSHNQDWLTPGASGADSVDEQGKTRTFKDYFESKCLPQVEEITRNYGPIELIWFDTPGNMPKEYAQKLVEVVRRNQPKALVSGRVGYNLGDYQTLGDMEVPLENIDGLWESVDVTNDCWGYSWYDCNWKSPRTILQNLVSTVARGGTYMLNVGPDGTGVVPEMAAQSLRVAGKWIERYPQVIYGATPSPWKHAMPWGDVVQQGNDLYLVVFKWPESGLLYLPGLKTTMTSASILVENQAREIEYSQGLDWTVLHVPGKRPETLASVIKINLKSSQVEVNPTLGVDPEFGQKNLSVKFAKLEGCHVHKSSWMEKFGEWKHMYCVNDLNNPGSKVTWTLWVKKPGIYQISLNLRGNSREVWKVETDERHIAQNQQRSSTLFAERPIGWIRVDRPGVHTITVSMPEGGQPTDLAGISILPVDEMP